MRARLAIIGSAALLGGLILGLFYLAAALEAVFATTAF